MLVPPAKDELAADRDDSGECSNSKIIGAEEKAQREGRNQRAFWIERRHVEIAGTGILSQLGSTEGDDDLPDGDIEVKEYQAIEEKGRQTGDLIEAWILVEGRFAWLVPAGLLTHEILLGIAVVLQRPSQEGMGQGGESFQRDEMNLRVR